MLQKGRNLSIRKGRKYSINKAYEGLKGVFVYGKIEQDFNY